MKNRTIATLKNYGVEPSSPVDQTFGSFSSFHKLESCRQRRAEKKELLVSSLFKSEWYFLIRGNKLLLSYGTWLQL